MNAKSEQFEKLHRAIFKQSRFRKNAATLLAGNSLGYAILLVALPIITRLYTPSNYAVLSIFTAAVALIQPFASIRLEWCIPNAKSEREANTVTFLALSSVAAFTLITIPAFALIGHSYAENYWIHQLGGFAWLLPIGILLACLLEILNAWTIRIRDLKPQAQAIVCQNSSGSLVQITGGLLQGHALWLICGFCTNKAIGSLVLIRHLRTNIVLRPIQPFRYLRAVARRHARTATTSSLVSSVNSLSLNLPIFIFASFYGATQTGLIAIALRIGAIIPLTIGRALNQSFWAEAAILVKENPQKLRQLYRSTTLKLGMLSIPVGAACMLSPHYLGYILGGDRWAQVGVILMALTPMIMSRIIFAQLSHLIVHERQHWQLYWDTLRACSIGALLIYAARSDWSMVQAVIALASLATAMNLILFILNSGAIHLSIKQSTRNEY